MRLTVTVIAAALCLLPGAVYADSKPWFGAKLPKNGERRAALDRRALTNPDIPPLSIRLPAEEDPFTDITGEELITYVGEVIDVTREHREGPYWGRIAGSKAEVKTAEYIANYFREFGLEDVALHPVKGGAQWWPLEWEVTLVGDEAYGDGTTDYTFRSAFPALQLGGEAQNFENLERELVYVGRGQPLDLVGRDLTGKIAVVLANFQPDPFFQTGRGYIDDIVAAGAAGVLTLMDAAGNEQYALEEMGPADAPAFVLGGVDGRFLLDVIEKAGSDTPIKARVSLKAEIRPHWEGANVVGTVRGTTDEWVVIMAHLDGYFDSANDNGGGLASLIALARFFADKDRPKPKRNMLFVGTSGHHEFSDGAEALIESHPRELNKAALVMNIEHPASTLSYFRGPLKFKRVTVPGQLTVTNTHGSRGLNVSNSNPILIDIYREAIDKYGLVVDAQIEKRPPTGDAIIFFSVGITVVQILDSNIWYHSDGDTLDTIPAAGMERATRVYAHVLQAVDGYELSEIKRRPKRP